MASKSDDWGGFLGMSLVCLIIYSCSGSGADRRTEQERSVISGDAPAPGAIKGAFAAVNLMRASFNEDRARQAAREFLQDETYEEEKGDSECLDDCSGHEAGWTAAKENEDCGEGNSDSFNDGCEAFQATVEDRVEDARERYEQGDDTFAGT